MSFFFWDITLRRFGETCRVPSSRSMNMSVKNQGVMPLGSRARKRKLTFNGRHRVISHKMELFSTTTVRTSKFLIVFTICPFNCMRQLENRWTDIYKTWCLAISLSCVYYNCRLYHTNVRETSYWGQHIFLCLSRMLQGGKEEITVRENDWRVTCKT